MQSLSRENVEDLRDIDNNTEKSHIHDNKSILDNVEVALTEDMNERYIETAVAHESGNYVTHDEYATASRAGTLKARLVGTTLYLTNNGNNA